ncbi:5-formyltetrahydrofolate cyclo-ligase [Allomuricauda sp. SCSIO 65647]|uniref:5-formyltetrahydrofolate cyclo-ligase n=1 Tax=Allomuricauda sp. SCSIO 65647 TaxID=2908843 RepID=UPI001F2E03C8|nr:5-formyltetrahydrofolate cyclo-ligase [Muricauda sp. SCSIO 65647]UJH66070.1 5-formyltetrahydrofolate cyclo-ligase [Muricauda sp. SCSIO 65647]
MLKHELRKIYKEKRKELSPFFISESSLKIVDRLLDLPLWDFSYYHIFLSIVDKKEVDTAPIINFLQTKGKNIVVPKMAASATLEHYLLTDTTTIAVNNWQVPEPSGSEQVEETKIDVVFIPLLAFDRLGNRIGYGKGYYDGFLRKCRSDTLKVGLSFFEAETVISGVADHDVRMDYCVTPKNSYDFSSTSS